MQQNNKVLQMIVPGEVVHCGLELLAGGLQVLVQLIHTCNLLLHYLTALLCCK